MAITTFVLLALTAMFIAKRLRDSGGGKSGQECPRCGHDLLPNQLRCSKCGVPLQVYEVITAPTAKPESSSGAESDAPHAVVLADRCAGCAACIPVCPEAGAIHMEGKLAVVDTALCKGHMSCVEACPVGAIFMGTGESVHRVEVPLVDAHFQSNVNNVFIAGELGGRGLIKNAVNEGRLAAEAAAKDLRTGRIEEIYDVIVVGSGPAGLSAALECQRLGVRFVVLEQGMLVDTIRKYPRKKLLLAEPVSIPLFGDLWIADGSKEELLAVWERLIEEHKLPILTKHRVQKVHSVPTQGIVEIETEEHGMFRAQRAILAVGRRGTPRKLGVPGEDSAKVYYDIVEMEAFAGDKIVVVGGGDSALESALGLANQANTTVHLSYRKGNFDRAKERNRSKLDAAVAKGSVHLLLESQLLEITENEVRYRIGDVEQSIANDSVIIRIGGEPPTKMLAETGVSIVTKDVPIATGAE